MSTDQKFLDELDKGEKKGGVFLFPGFIPPEEHKEVYNTLNNDFPWDLEPKLFGEKLKQHAYSYKRTRKEKTAHKGLALLDNFCRQLEQRFDGEISDVFCNRFQDPDHRIEWHTDTYASHIFVLTLGSERDVQFRPKKRWFSGKKQQKQIETIRPAIGDLYFMPLQLNNTHEHRVCSAAASGNDSDGIPPRLSFVFFFDPPKYAKDYRITAMDKVRGFYESIME